MYKITLSAKAQKDLEMLLKSEPKAYDKVLLLLAEIMLHPRTGLGKPQLKKYNLAGLYSRRITDKHRLVYSIDDEIITVYVISARGHYADK
ncbi:Txe/YoeB family addiction module toxin [Sphingobacterium hungaricum]|uniref:Putative mRNA interferase YoeB n=1 Tax=Sphingobacterium hungaricum TaxID=2082723 RepID=A0A928YPM0_9SPHI|nr:Txe/YoeB family addiction module toxin [Sphingobacterium hungaricum]MBE8713054.1 Txe/YoeB family addiction module toxin [Sphingobacterium hungaricum]